MKYFVTYCTMDEKLGSNPFWHSCVIFSKYDETTKKMEVEDTWSFYGTPPLEDINSTSRTIKRKLKLDVSFNGAHGKWKKENTRDLDRGEGLHGRTYELTQDQYESLLESIKNKKEAEDQAIEEAARELNLNSQREFKIYAYEHKADVIFQHEQKKAKEERRPSRLKAFEFTPGLSLRGPHFRNSNTCKSRVVEALSETLTPEQIHGLTEKGKHPTVPHYSGDVEHMYLYSTGSFSVHEKRSGEKVFFRGDIGSKSSENDEPVQVFWTLPPQKYDALTPDTETLFHIPYADKVKDVVSRLQRLEWKLRNAKLAPASEAKREQLLTDIVNSYQIFSMMNHKQPLNNTSLYTSALSFFKIPQTVTELEIKQQIARAAECLRNVHEALNQEQLECDVKVKNEINSILNPGYLEQLYDWAKAKAIPSLFR